jgi:hypothetical protein
MHIKSSIRAIALIAVILLLGTAQAQTTSIKTEYLGTLYAPLDPPQVIDNTLYIYNVQPGGWFKGPKLSAKVVQPAADWLRVMPAGNARLDVRLTLKTEDDQLIYVTYGGVISHSKESFDRLMKGEVLTAKDFYFITAPTMQSASEKYSWVNHLQAVGKVVEVKAGEGSYVKYDLFIVR